MPKETLIMIGNYLPITHWNKNVWHYLAENLEEAGWEVITTSSKENQILRLMDMVKTVWRESKNFHLAQIDVFSGKAFIFAQVCSYLLWRMGKPIVLTLHGGGLPNFASSHPKRVNRVLARAKAVVSPSPYHQVELKKYYADICLIPNPIDLSTAIYRSRQAPTAKLIWVRAFHNVYNPSLAPKVLHNLADEFPEIELMMIGPDKGDGSLGRMLSLAEKLGVRERIQIVGGIVHTEIPTWLNKGDIFINTTNFDTAPRSVLEAMANGLCVVSTDVGGVPDLVDHELEGLLIPPDDAPAMAAAIRRLLTEPGLGAALSKNARTRAENYDWSKVLPKWEALFNRIIDN